MADSIISSLTNLLDRQTIGSLASRLGESEGSISRALGPTFAAILGGLINKTSDSGSMRQIFDMVKSAPADALSGGAISNLLSEGGASSPIAEMGRRLLPMLFSSDQAAVENSIEKSAGLSAGAASRLMSVGVPMVLSFLGSRVRTEGIGLAGFTNLLQGESGNIKKLLPAGWSSLWNTTASTGVEGAQAVAAPVERTAKGAVGWLLPVGVVLALLLAFAWLLRRDGGEAAKVATTAASETATRARAAVSGLGEFVARQLPDNIRLTIPENGVEARLLSFIQDGSQTVSSDVWFDFDRLIFDTASAIPKPESHEQLQNIASIMKAYPNVHIKIGGYTDNVGNAAANIRLSENRAQAVRRELIGMGIAESRLEADGYGNRHPIADNSTEEGRARNRRISMRVLQK